MFQLQGFHIIIGNPPYMDLLWMESTLRQELQSYFNNPSNLYECFILVGHYLNLTEGILSYIIPATVATHTSKLNIRELFLQNQLINVTELPRSTFTAEINTLIFSLLKKLPISTTSYSCSILEKITYKHRFITDITYTSVKTHPKKSLLLKRYDSQLIRRLFCYPKLKDICVIRNGHINTGNVMDKILLKELDPNKKLEKFLQGRQINKYSFDWDSPKARYKYCDLNYKPKNKKGKKRDGSESNNNEYWSFTELSNSPNECLLYRKTGDHLVVTYYNTNLHGIYYTDATLCFIFPVTKISIKYLLALLNSRLLDYLYQYLAQEKKRIFAEVKRYYIYELPINLSDSIHQDPIIELVNKILKNRAQDPSADITEFQQSIDHQIYQIYQLTPEEIQLIETSS